VVDSGLPSASLNTIGRSALHPRFGADRVEAAIQAVPITTTTAMIVAECLMAASTRRRRTADAGRSGRWY